MDEIRRQVGRTRRRLTFNQLVHALTWSVLATSMAALVAIGYAKLRPVPIDGRLWAILWIAGALAAGISAGLVWTWSRRRDELAAAIELDLRFGLKERVSSALALSPAQREGEAGQALLNDARQRVQRIDVGERFGRTWSWQPLLPVGTLVLTLLVALLWNDAIDRQEAAASTQATTGKQVRKSMEDLRKKLAERKKRAEASGLKEAEAVFTKFQKAVDMLSQKDIDRRKALVKLNNLTKQLADRRQSLNGANEMRKQLQQLKNFERGPADRIAQAMKDGDMKRALEELKKLGDKLRSDSLSQQEKESLRKQLEQLQKEIQKMLTAKNELERQKRELQERVNELKQQGDLDAASKLQRRIDQLQEKIDAMGRENPQLGRLEQLAQQLGQAAQAMKQGNNSQAANQLNQMAQALQQMQSELDELQAMDELMDEIADAKNAMNCKKCGGEGCEACQNGALGAQAMKGMLAQKPGPGMTEGQGMGERPEEKTDTGGYRARVGAKPRAGQAIRVGDASGPNISGASRESVQEEIAGAFSEDPEPVTHQHLPRREREQTKEYFELLRKGQ